MTDRRTTDDRWLDWLGEGPAHAPTALLGEVLAELPAQRGRRRARVGAPWGRLVTHGVALGAGAVLMIGLLGAAGALRSDPGPVASPVPTPAPSTGVRLIGSTVLSQPMFTARADAAAVTLADGRPVVVRGVDTEGLAPWVEPYDPVAYRFNMPETLRYGGGESAAVLLDDGSVFVTGGPIGITSERVSVAPPGSPPGRGTVTPLPQDRARTQAGVARLLDGRVLLAGGTDRSDTLETTDLFDPADETFTPTGELVVPRRGAFAVTLPDGRVLLAGGTDGSDQQVSMVETWDPATGRWSELGELPVNIAVTSATVLPDGAVLVVGTRQEPGFAGWWSTPVRIDPVAGTLIALPGNDVSADATITLLPDGDVLAIGGRYLLDTGPVTNVSIVRLDPVTGATQEVAQLQVARWRHTAALLPDGSVLIAGGDSDAESVPGKTDATILDSAEILLSR